MRKVRVYYKGRYYYLGKAKNLEEELNLNGTVGGILIGIKLKKVPMRVCSVWVLTMTLVMRLLVSVLIYNSLTEMQQNTQLKHLNHCI